jgi:hypothetical protein
MLKLTPRRFFAPAGFLSLAMMVCGVCDRVAVANSISFSPAEGNALTPFTINVSGFIGTNGPAPVDVNGGGIVGSCSSARPCTFAANMGYFSGKHWVTASAMVDGVNVVVSNYFTVREAGAQLNRACGTNGTKVIVTGYDFARNQYVYVDGTPTPANSNGLFAFTLTLNVSASGPYKIVSSDGFRFVTNTFDVGPNTVCEPNVGRAAVPRGGVTITRPGGQPQPLNPGDPVRVGDLITAGAGGPALVTFTDGSSVVLTPNGSYKIDAFFFEPANSANDNSFLNLLKGALIYTTGLIGKREDNVGLNTSYGSIGIRGTEFISRRDPCSTTQEVYLIHGQLAITPTNSTTTNIINAPATIYFDATNVWTNGLTQATYAALLSELNQTNPVTFASWQTQYFGCTNDNAAALATADPDGDGQDNYAEFLARTDPTSSASVFKLIGATREGDGVRLAWQTHGGVTNVVQAASSLDGSYSNLSPDIVIAGDADVTTNYLDAGVLTNAAARFYRIRLAR